MCSLMMHFRSRYFPRCLGSSMLHWTGCSARAILINTSRGGVVQTEALVAALDEEILCGVGLDVLEGEEAIKEEAQLLADKLPVEKLRALVMNYALLHRDNVIITPHVAFYSAEAEERIITTTLENITGFLEGTPRNVVRPK